MTANETLDCTICRRGLFADELGRFACRPCEQRIDTNLAALAGPDGLYARLGAVLAPGRGSGGPAVSGSRTAPLPVRLGPLSLIARGGVVTILQSWLTDWHEQLGYRHPRWDGGMQQQLDQAAHRLRVLLPWACAEHPAIDEFASELASLKRQCETAAGEERPPRRIPVACPCGTVLRVTLDTAGARCPGCQQQYGHSEVLGLPMAERRAA